MHVGVVCTNDNGLSCILVVCASRPSVADSLVVFLFVILHCLILTQCIYIVDTYNYLLRCSFLFLQMWCCVPFLQMDSSSRAERLAYFWVIVNKCEEDDYEDISLLILLTFMKVPRIIFKVLNF
jgi:hypothetical protein